METNVYCCNCKGVCGNIKADNLHGTSIIFHKNAEPINKTWVGYEFDIEDSKIWDGYFMSFCDKKCLIEYFEKDGTPFSDELLKQAGIENDG